MTTYFPALADIARLWDERADELDPAWRHAVEHHADSIASAHPSELSAAFILGLAAGALAQDRQIKDFLGGSPFGPDVIPVWDNCPSMTALAAGKLASDIIAGWRAP